MPIDVGAFGEADKKKQKITEKEKKEKIKKTIKYKKTKDKLSLENESEKKLINLKELLVWLDISSKTVHKINNWECIWEEEIQEIFEKIDEIEAIDDISEYTPNNLKITRDDYIRAISEEVFRAKIITKINSSIIILMNKINWNYSKWVKLLSNLLKLLKNHLIIIDRNGIVIKGSLKGNNNKLKNQNKIDI